MTNLEQQTVENLILAYQGIQILLTNYNKAMQTLTQEQQHYYNKRMLEELKNGFHD